MEFNVNHPVLFVLAGLLVAVVLGQSVYFLLKALKRSRELGMDQRKIKKTIKTAAIFTIAPAVAIVISVITLSKKLGLPLPWLRLSVVGSMSYDFHTHRISLCSGLQYRRWNCHQGYHPS